MSLILDALNRADNERKNQDVVPGLNTVHPAPVMVVEEKPADKNGLYIAIVISVLALAASVYWFVAKPEQKQKVITAPSVESPQNNETETNTALLAEQIQPTAESVSVSSSFIQDKADESVIAPKPTAVVEQLYSAPATQAVAADPKVNELYAVEEEVAPSQSIEDPFPSPPTRITDISAVRNVVAEARPVRNFASIINVQDFNELPWNTKQQIPTISYQRHNFLAGGVSSVVINGQTLGEGNIAASSQIIVQEIFEDGVVLKRGNTIFKLRALNGWINM